MSKTTKLKITMILNVNNEYAKDFKKLEHHAGYLLDLDSHPEIKSVYGVVVDALEES